MCLRATPQVGLFAVLRFLRMFWQLDFNFPMVYFISLPHDTWAKMSLLKQVRFCAVSLCEFVWCVHQNWYRTIKNLTHKCPYVECECLRLWQAVKTSSLFDVVRYLAKRSTITTQMPQIYLDMQLQKHFARYLNSSLHNSHPITLFYAFLVLYQIDYPIHNYLPVRMTFIKWICISTEWVNVRDIDINDDVIFHVSL